MSTPDNTTMPISLQIDKEIRINAPIEVCFESMLEQLGPKCERPDGFALPMTLELWPGGRWFRDLGDDNGHLWGHVQVVKRPTLLEITGPLFMSMPAVSHLRYKLTEEGDATVMTFSHQSIGPVLEEFKENADMGWRVKLEQIRDGAEAAAGR